MIPFKKLFGKTPSNDPILWISGEDPEMQSAIRRAQKSYPEFQNAILQDMNRVVPCIVEALVKYAFPTKSRHAAVEHMFLSDFEAEGSDLYGYLASEPKYAKAVKEGDRIKINQSEVSDWLIVSSEEITGGDTFEVMWSGFTDEEREVYRDQPPFCWLQEKLS